MGLEPNGECYDRGIPFFGENGFRMTGLLSQNRREKTPLFFLPDSHT